MTHRNQITDPAAVCTFIRAGKAKFTLVSQKTGTRFTYKVRKKDDETPMWFVSVLSGPENEADYTYIGFCRDGQNELIAGRKGRADAPSFKAFNWFISRVRFEATELPQGVEFWHEGACAACGRTLTVPTSIATGFGPHCAAKLGIEMEIAEEAANEAAAEAMAESLTFTPVGDNAEPIYSPEHSSMVGISIDTVDDEEFRLGQEIGRDIVETTNAEAREALRFKRFVAKFEDLTNF